MLSSLDISSSALVAQRLRMTAIANNIANLSTTHNEAGESKPYQPRFVVFQTDETINSPLGAAGVKVSSVETAHLEPRWKYQPGHPDAAKEGPHQGYVAYPNINMMTEFTDAIEATRAYEANVGVIEATKDLLQHSLRILA
ncbi:MAG TPA: flagellar basal body rod protein FlgC [Pirellulales bacterium]